MDPTAAARNWRDREQQRRRERAQRTANREDDAQAGATARAAGNNPNQTPLEILATLPTATSGDAGRIIHVRNNADADTLNIGVTQADGTVTWVPLNVTLSANALRYSPVGTYGSFGTSAGQFASPAGVAVDASGNIYVADTSNNRVQKLTLSTNTWTTLGGLATGAGNGQFNAPFGITVDPSTGNVLVADTNNNRVQVLTSVIAYSAQFGTAGSGNGNLSVPLGLAVTPAGVRVVVDTGNNRTESFTSLNAYSSQFGSLGTGNGQFNGPASCAIDPSGAIWVSDTNNHRIQKFTSAGAYSLQVGTYGTGNGQFNGPRGIACDSSGNVFVSDGGNHRVQVFNASGQFLTAFGSYGTGTGYLNAPRGIAVSPFGLVYVAEVGNNRISTWAVATSNVLSAYTEVEDFNGGNTSTGTVGELGWSVSGQGNATIQATETYHTGIIRLSSGGTSGNKHQLNFGPFLVDQLRQTQFVFRPNDNTSVFHRVGLADSASTPTQGIYAEVDTNVPDTTWKAVKMVTSVATRSDTGLTWTNAVWYRVTLDWVSSGAVNLTIRRMDTGQEFVVAHTGLNTTTGLLLFFLVQTRANAAKTLDCDAALFQVQNVWRT